MSLRTRVENLRCASCVLTIEQRLGALAGVRSVRVNFSTGSCLVDFEPPATEQAILQHLHGLGYHTTSPAERTHSIVERWGPTLFLLVLASLFMILSMIDHHAQAFGWVQLLLSPLAILWGGAEFHRGALLSLKRRTANMDTLVSLGTLTSLAYSLWAFAIHQPTFFETGVSIVALVKLGRTLEARARAHATHALDALMSLSPSTATVQIGDEVVVLPGSQVPADGQVLEGCSSIDESLVTGESNPVQRGVGERVLGGTHALDGRLVVRVTQSGRETLAGQIAELLEETQASRSRTQRMADRASAWFVPGVLAAALATFLGWYAHTHEISRSVINAVAVLVVACPCALGLAAPVAIVTAVGQALRMGVLVRYAAALEDLARVRTIVFDKTGTLTQGELSLEGIQAAAGFDAQNLLRWAASVEGASRHPVALAICRAYSKPAAPVEDFRYDAGAGCEGKVEGHVIRIGTAYYLERGKIPVSVETEGTLVHMAIDGKYAGTFRMQDQMRMEVPTLIRELQSRGIGTALVSGDREAVVSQVASQAAIERWVADVSPFGKAQFIKDLQSEGKKVAFIGDGINDAPALAAADVGIALGSGSDIAASAGGLVLIRSDLALLPRLLSLSRAVRRIIAQNLAWAFGYNIILIPLSAMGRVHPMLACTTMAVSSLAVVINALRLRR